MRENVTSAAQSAIDCMPVDRANPGESPRPCALAAPLAMLHRSDTPHASHSPDLLMHALLFYFFALVAMSPCFNSK